MSESAKPPKVTIDRQSAVPAWRQLAEELRYRIATGELAVGARLPTVAAGGKAWKLNLHTVRRAYGELAADGLIETIRGRGTKVIAQVPAAPVAAREGVGAFIDWAAAHAAREFGLAPEEFAELITSTAPVAPAQEGVTIVECSAHQADHLARQLGGQWMTAARGWSLERKGEPPAGPFIATLFHYNDIRRRWPHRMKDAVFISIRPAQGLEETLRRFGRQRGPLTVHMVEREEPMARSIAADVSVLLPSRRFVLVPSVLTGPPTRLRFKDGELYLFAPRIWAELSQAQREAVNTAEVEYAIPAEEHRRLAHRFGWALRDDT